LLFVQSLQCITNELQSKTLSLADAERRFSELEQLMQRIVARSAGVGMLA
jgi:hypothetical protein